MALGALASALVRSMEALGVRGAPTLLRRLSRVRALRTELATVTLPAGQRITFPAFDPYWARYLWAGVPFEPDVEAIFRRFAPGRVLVDCGANIGYWSARASELGFAGVVAIEANADLIPLLRRNAPEARVVHAAIYSESGKLMHLGGTDDHAAASLAATGKPVQSISLRDLARDIQAPLLVKLDVEGAEIPALEGAGDIDAIYVIEDWPSARNARWLLDHDFSLFGFANTPRSLASVDDVIAFNRETVADLGPSNLLAVARSRDQAVRDQLRL
jgi:FkbM family methyltransferase